MNRNSLEFTRTHCAICMFRVPSKRWGTPDGEVCDYESAKSQAWNSKFSKCFNLAVGPPIPEYELFED